jgi:cysteine desulfuration protein SufE
MISDVVETFSFFSTWEERYSYIIELGAALPPFPEAARTQANKVSGCVSQVWLTYTLKEGLLFFAGDSDSHLVKGLIAIVLDIYSQRSAEDIVQSCEPEKILEALKLDEGLTPQRSNGLHSFVRRIHCIAETYL